MEGGSSDCEIGTAKGRRLDDQCYAVIDDQKNEYSWYTARSYCHDRGADLASFDKLSIVDELRVFVIQQAAKASKGCIWLGLRRLEWFWPVNSAFGMSEEV